MSSVSRVYVHVGPFKSGTTFIQAVLQANRDRLAGNGVVVPRPDWGAHVASVVDLLRHGRARSGHADSGEWQLLVDDIAAADAHTALISMEFLSGASRASVRRMVETLAPAEIHVVYTARDLVKVIPSAWQTVLRTGHTPTWEAWIASVAQVAGELDASAASVGTEGRRRPRARSWGAKLWRQQDPRQVLARYLDQIPADRIHVVTVPPSSAVPGQLWQRFCDATGLDAGAYETSVRRSNPSLGGVECEVLRRLNGRVAGRIPDEVFTDVMKLFLAREVLEQRPQSFPLVLPPEHRVWVTPRTTDAVTFLGGSGFAVYGDLDELSSAPDPPSARRPDDVSDAEVLPVMEEALSAVLLEMARRQGLLPYSGPRSHEEPLPDPAELGLTGAPPGPGERAGVRVDRSAAED
jgi:hypothetical protein